MAPQAEEQRVDAVVAGYPAQLDAPFATLFARAHRVPLVVDAMISLAKDKDRLARMEQAASRAGRPEAAREIVDACFELVERR